MESIMKYDPVTERKITSLAARLLVAAGPTQLGSTENVIRRMFEVAEMFNAECERRRGQ
jgi:hypothetical protein